jgi:nucleoside-diphosphate-sugar epimerase
VNLDDARAALRDRKVLVTGAGGFIGGRLVERLVLECGAEVRVLVRSLGGAVRLARFALDFRRGDVTDGAAMAAAAEGCDVVFHCAYGTTGSQRLRARVNREGTRQALAAAQAAGARLVHLSTLMVYGRTGAGDLDESAPRRRFGNPYAASKLAAERLVLAAARAGRVPAVVLQPTAVFGPWGGVWTARVLATLKGARTILVDGGTGLANYVYVDDLVSAMLLAAVVPEAVGEALLISSAEPVTWREWYERFARMLGGPPRTVTMSAEEALAHWRRARRARPRLAGELLAALRGDRALRERLFETRELRAAREAASALLPESWQRRIKARLGMGAPAPPAARPAPGAKGELPIQPLSPAEIDFHRPRTRVRIDRAARLLGYRPAFDLEAGMALTEAWARWADLL